MSYMEKGQFEAESLKQRTEIFRLEQKLKVAEDALRRIASFPITDYMQVVKEITDSTLAKIRGDNAKDK